MSFEQFVRDELPLRQITIKGSGNPSIGSGVAATIGTYYLDTADNFKRYVRFGGGMTDWEVVPTAGDIGSGGGGGGSGTITDAISSNWENTYTTVESNSSNWNLNTAYTGIIGDNSTNPITVNHNLNTKNIVFSIRDRNTDEFVFVNGEATDADNLILTFTDTPTAAEYDVTVLNTGGETSGPGVDSIIATNDTSVATSDTGHDGKILFTTDGTSRWEISPAGHLLPTTNQSYDIGSAERKVRHLYLSNSTIYIGDSTDQNELQAVNSDFFEQVAPAAASTTDLIDGGVDGQITVVSDGGTQNEPVLAYRYDGQWLTSNGSLFDHVITRGAFSIEADTPSFIAMQEDSFAGDTEWANVNYIHTLLLPYDATVHQVLVRGGATAGGTMSIGMHTNNNVIDPNTLEYKYFPEAPLESNLATFSQNNESQIVTFTQAASAVAGKTIGLSLSADQHLGTVNVTITLKCKTTNTIS